MREIKFRGKDGDKEARNPNGRFVANDPIFSEIKYRLLNNDTGLTSVYTLRELISKTYRRAKFEFRGRCTGLKDKNGKDVFEGDIIQLYKHMSGEKGEVTVVEWDIEKCQYSGIYPNIQGWIQHEVIGNIYENPNLLSQDK